MATAAMSAPLVAVAVAVSVVAGRLPARPRRRVHRRATVLATAPRPTSSGHDRWPDQPAGGGPAATSLLLGGTLLALVRLVLATGAGRLMLIGVGRLAGRIARRPPLDDDAAARLGGWVAAVAALMAVGWWTTATLVVGGWAASRLRARRVRRAGVRHVRSVLPETVDLLRLGVGAGLNVPLAVALVAERGPEPVATSFARAVAATERGDRLAEALDRLPAELGDDARPVVAALAASLRDGVAVEQALAQLAADVRGRRRQEAEEAARAVPVKLLFPLVLCGLPAFVLLTIVPLVAGAVPRLGLGS